MMTFYWYDDNNNVVKSVQGTGFLIAEDVVVTARHNFYQRSKLDQKCTSCTIQLRNPKNHSEIITYRSKSSSEWFEHK
jgi:V8-like Glu-specific endopeptidase